MTAWKAETLLSDLCVNMTEGLSASIQRINKGFSNSGSYLGLAYSVFLELLNAVKLAASIFAMMCIKHLLDGSTLQFFITTTLTSAITAATQYLLALPIIAQIVVLSLVMIMGLPYLLGVAKPISGMLTSTAKALITRRRQTEHVDSQQLDRRGLPNELKSEILHAFEYALERAYDEVIGRPSTRATIQAQTTLVDTGSNKQLHTLVCQAAQAIFDEMFSGDDNDSKLMAAAFAKHLRVQLRMENPEPRLTLGTLNAHTLHSRKIMPTTTNRKHHRSDTPHTATTCESKSVASQFSGT